MFLLYSPLNQGLKQILIQIFLQKSNRVFTLQSIKSRIETPIERKAADWSPQVFTLQSIKSRIETLKGLQQIGRKTGFLLYSPLNQGLKHAELTSSQEARVGFLLYSPLNQGLKLIRQRRQIRQKVCFYSTVH